MVDIPDRYKDIRHLLNPMPTITPDKALLLPPLGPWDGCLFANLASLRDSNLVTLLFKRWRPAIAILSIPSTLSRAEITALLPTELPKFYKKKILTCRHTAVGGVTTASRRFIHYTRWADILLYPSLMTRVAIPRNLQTALADTYGAAPGRTFETRVGLDFPEAIGLMTPVDRGSPAPVFSGDRLGPDLALIPPSDLFIWVLAHSVFRKDMVLRQARISELMAIWDYEGKLESWGWSRQQALAVLKARLLCPPAKMLQCFAQSVCEAILTNLEGHQVDSNSGTSGVVRGLTSDVPFSPLEAKVTTRLTAAQADQAEVDLSAWAVPMETSEQAKARVVLRRFAVRWWAFNLRREAMPSWNRNGRDPRDLAAIQDCVFRARASSYWHWHRGSRLFFWRFPRSFISKCAMGFPFITLRHVRRVMHITCPPHLEKPRLNVERRFSNFDIGTSLRKGLQI